LASRVRIAIECMGGDFGLSSTLPAAVNAVKIFPDIELVLVGDQQDIASFIHRNSCESPRLSIVHADEIVQMSDKPSFALRKKVRSSMRVAIDLLASREVDAVVSAGNTGALMAMGCYVLKTMPGIDRPAICSSLPGLRGRCHLLDLGANVDTCAEHLHQFAIMGSALSSTVDGLAHPRVAVLNIGEEDIKGNEQVKLAIKLIEADKQLNFLGSIEGDRIFSGEADVIVCDGFVGNIALKVCEGTAAYVNQVVRQQFTKDLMSKLAGWIAGPVLKRVSAQLDPQQYNGASFLGLQGVVIKSHGNSSIKSFQLAIAQARSEVESGMLEVIDQRMAALAV
jgi:phosphate acyltransferase